jgi:site-specific recombinase XerD
MDLTQIGDEFIRQGRYLRNWSPRTVRTYQQGLRALRRGIGDTLDRPTLTKADLQTFVIGMRERGLTAGGCNMYIRTVNSFLSWLHAEGHLPDRLRVSLLSNPPKIFRGFSDTEMRQVVGFRSTSRADRRAWTLFVCLLDTGIRIEEALGLEQARVDLEGLTITVLGKGNRERMIPISATCRKALYALIAKHRAPRSGVGSKSESQLVSEPPRGRYVFATSSGARLTYRNAYRDLKTVCERAGVTGAHVRPHNIRHYFAVTFLRSGGDLYRLSRILGHSSITTTQLYLRSMGLEHLREGHARYSTLERALA